MNKQEFLDKLTYLLQDIPQDEKEEAIGYYKEYIEDGENEESVIASLGDVNELAKEIKAGVENKTDYVRDNEIVVNTSSVHKNSRTIKGNYSSVNDGYNNYSSSENNNNYTNNSYSESENSYQQEDYNSNNRCNSGSRLLYTILAIFTFPVWFPVLIVILAVAFALIVSVVAISFGLGIASIVLVAVGIGIVAGGMSSILAAPLTGAAMTGSGLVLSGLGLFFAAVIIWMAGAVIPVIIRAIVGFFRFLFNKISGRR